MRKVLLGIVCLSVAHAFLSIPATGDAAAIKLSDYWFSKGAGDVWTYGYTQPQGVSDFTVAITRITSGDYFGKYRQGDYRDPDGTLRWRIVSYDASYFFLFYDSKNGAFNPPGQIPVNQQLDQVLPHPLNSNGAWYFKKVDQLTVPAGTYRDILLMINLDKSYGPNAANNLFGLPPSVTYGVTHANWYAWGIGELQDVNYDAATGAPGNTYKLKTTNANLGGRGLPPTCLLLLAP